MDPTREEFLFSEIARLHTRLDDVQRAQYAGRSFLGALLHDLEYNPRTQYKIHITAAYFWIINLVIVLLLQAFFPTVWVNIAVLYVAIVSLYSNFATDYGAASSALAAMGSNPLPEIPTETH